MAKSYLSSEKEFDLVTRLVSQQQEAFVELYDRYAPTLFGVIQKMVRNEDEAQDLLQDVMVKVWKNIHRHDPAKGRLFTWLLNMTRNTVIDYFRVQKRKQVGPLEWATDDTLTRLAIAQPNAHYIGFGDTVAASLLPKYQQVVDLIYFQGYSHQDAADALKLPLGTVKTRVRMALQQLKVVFCRDARVEEAMAY